MTGRPLALEAMGGPGGRPPSAPGTPGAWPAPPWWTSSSGTRPPIGAAPGDLPPGDGGRSPSTMRRKRTGKPATPESFIHIDDIPAGAPSSPRGTPPSTWTSGTAPSFSFGYGLGYTSLPLRNIWPAVRPELTMDGSIQVEVDVVNTGARAGDEVVQLYIRDPVASTTRPGAGAEGVPKGASGARGSAAGWPFELNGRRPGLLGAEQHPGAPSRGTSTSGWGGTPTPPAHPHPPGFPPEVRVIPPESPRVEALLRRMTPGQKIGQMTQPERMPRHPGGGCGSTTSASVLSGGGSWPGANRPADWVPMNDAYWSASMEEGPGPPGHPILYGVGAIHGNNNVLGGHGLPPHNIGLGAADDPELVARVAAVTARESWPAEWSGTFGPHAPPWSGTSGGGAPTRATPGEPGLVSRYAGAFRPGAPAGVRPRRGSGLRQALGGGRGTTGGIDQGETTLSEAELPAPPPSPPTCRPLEAGVLTVHGVVQQLERGEVPRAPDPHPGTC